MIDVRALKRLDAADLWRVAAGYTSDGKYAVVHTDTEGRVSFQLRLVALEKPYVKKYDHYDEETLGRYNRILDGGYSFGAYDGALLVGLLIAEAQGWNRSLVVSEFHVAETHRAAGIGRRLMERAAEAAGRAGLRIIVCETQNTNATSIAVYRRLGFRMEGVDISLYRNTDYPDGEMAVFMKRRLP
jgi:ribosomal protein S18 acetylase RimI-like enzyme